MVSHPNFSCIILWNAPFLALFPSPALFVAAQTTDPVEINAEVTDEFASLLLGTHPQDPVVFRVDELAENLSTRATNGIANEQERINFVMNGLGVSGIWSDCLFDPSTGQSDLTLFVAAMLGLLPGNFGIDPYPGFLQSRAEALALQQQGRNFSREIQQHYDVVLAQYQQDGVEDGTPVTPLPSPQLDVAPIYQVSYGYLDATNARTTGWFPADAALEGLAGRCNIHLNLGARRMLQEEYFAIAVVHETWHCFHSPLDTSPADLLKQALREGVVTYLTARTLDEHSLSSLPVEKADLLFWSQEELQAAKDRRLDIIAAFEQDKKKTDLATIQEWIFLGNPLSSVPGAPSRSAYFVGWLAVQAYVERLSLSSTGASSAYSLAKHLLDLVDSPQGRDEIFRALLDGKTSAPTPTTKSASSLDDDPESTSGAAHAQLGWWLTAVQLLIVLLLSSLDREEGQENKDPQS